MPDSPLEIFRAMFDLPSPYDNGSMKYNYVADRVYVTDSFYIPHFIYQLIITLNIALVSTIIGTSFAAQELASVTEDTAEEETDTEGDFSIDAVAAFLATRLAKPVAAVVSPAGDSGSTTTVMLARALSETGRSVVLVDMTATQSRNRRLPPGI